MRQKKFITFFICLIMVIMVASGCKPAARRPAPTPPTRTRVTPTPAPAPVPAPRTAPAPKPVPKMTPTKVDNRSYVARANKIADKVTKLHEVDKSTCVITGDTAMIGVEFSKQYKGKMTDAVKKKVEKTAKEADPKIKKVVVTADPDIYSRLKNMMTDIGKGKPLSGFATEMKELLNRIQPKTK